VNIKNNIGKMNKNLENKIIFGIMFEVNLLFYGSSGGHKMIKNLLNFSQTCTRNKRTTFPKLARSWIKRQTKVTLSGWKMNSPPNSSFV